MALFESARSARRFLRNLTLVLAAGLLAVFAPLRSFHVSGASMQPLLRDGEKILVESITPRLHALHRGDVIVFRHPLDQKRYLVKRVIGLGGDTVAISQGTVIVNGLPLAEGYLASGMTGSRDHAEIRLDPSTCYVLGDDRSISEDSRIWGSIPVRSVVGRALFAYWPLSRAGAIH